MLMPTVIRKLIYKQRYHCFKNNIHLYTHRNIHTKSLTVLYTFSNICNIQDFIASLSQCNLEMGWNSHIHRSPDAKISNEERVHELQ